MNRADLQKLSNIRIREAKVLLEAKEYSGAYYLAGYAVECALKACFAKKTKRYDFPDRNSAGKVFTHKLVELARLANLEADLSAAKDTSLDFDASWSVVCNWTEESRYSTKTRTEAEEIIQAISGMRDGVLPWIKRRW